jgi:hypothetical protein
MLFGEERNRSERHAVELELCGTRPAGRLGVGRNEQVLPARRTARRKLRDGRVLISNRRAAAEATSRHVVASDDAQVDRQMRRVEQQKLFGFEIGADARIAERSSDCDVAPHLASDALWSHPLRQLANAAEAAQRLIRRL